MVAQQRTKRECVEMRVGPVQRHYMRWEARLGTTLQKVRVQASNPRVDMSSLPQEQVYLLGKAVVNLPEIVAPTRIALLAMTRIWEIAGVVEEAFDPAIVQLGS
jgi:hypothetical protein